MLAPTLTTERLVIRATTMDDWEDYVAAWANPVLTRFIGGQPRSRQESWGKFNLGIGLWPLLGHGYWTFADRATDRYLGNGGLGRFERGFPELEGYPEAGWAFVPDAWGQGLATEAMGAIIQWADAHLDAPEIRCIVDWGNHASRRVAAKLDFVQIGKIDDPAGRTLAFSRIRRPT